MGRILNNSNSQSILTLPPPCCPGPTDPYQSTNTGEDTLIHTPNEDQQGCWVTVRLQLKDSRMVVMQWSTLSIASVQKYTPVSRQPTSGPPMSVYLYLRRETLVRWPTTLEYPSYQSARRCTTRSYSIESETMWIQSYENNQAGLRPGRSCAQQIHILRRIMECFQDYQLPLTITFTDFKKAFDSIDRKVMFADLRHYGISVAVVNAITALYINYKSAVLVEYSWTLRSFYWSPAGWFLAPFLFIMLVDYLMRKATSDLDSGVETHPRRSRRYPAKVLNDLDFADELSCWNPQWLGHRPSWPVYQQQKILALWLVFPRHSTWLQIVTPSFTSSLWSPHQPCYWLQISWLQNDINCILNAVLSIDDRLFLLTLNQL